jgi:hypothetical protein
MSLPWHARNHQDALDGMLMLTLEERGAYNTILDLIYSRQGPIPDDARWLIYSRMDGRASAGGTRSAPACSSRASSTSQPQRRAVADEPARRNRDRKRRETSRNLSESGAKGGRKSAETRANISENNGEGKPRLKPRSS